MKILCLFLKFTILTCATSPGNTASDGDGKNGLHTEALMIHMKTPGITIEQMLKG